MRYLSPSRVLHRPAAWMLLAFSLLSACKEPSAPAARKSAQHTPPATQEERPQPAATPDQRKAPPTQAESAPVAIPAQEAEKPTEARELAFVQEGRAIGVVILSSAAEAEPVFKEAAEHFAAIVERATGARLQILGETEAASLPPETPRLVITSSAEAEAMEPETYRIHSVGDAVYITGSDKAELPAVSRPAHRFAPRSRPTLWALNRILEEQLGVRWLWPGELGTYVPKSASFTIPVYDVTHQPKLMLRSLRIASRSSLGSSDYAADEKIREEAQAWAENHQSGRRGAIRFGHAFGKWWERFSETHPGYFADVGPKLKQPYPKPDAAKLRLANPAVIEQIAQDYTAAGAPKYYNVCPNDGSGFDISPETRAWDIPRNQDPSKILRARGELTARYIEFWNRLYARLVQINPEVVLTTYAYSCYRTPPPRERPLKAKAIFAIVPTLQEFDIWEGWAATGSPLFLRPNWWHLGADAPYITVNESAKYIAFAAERGMLGLDMDSVLGYWGTQGINYYAVARLMTRPELSPEEIIAEYTAAFGAGAHAIRDYIAYWQTLTPKYNYTHLPREGAPSNKSKYQELVAQGKVPRSILNGSKYVLPYLYPEKVIVPAERFLDKAEMAIGNNDPEALARVKFLREGLRSLRATREQIALGQKIKRQSTPTLLRRFKEQSEALNALREELTASHVIWAAAAARHENRYQVLIRPENLKHHQINLDGM